jgi:diadenylate cyclase
MSGLLNEIAFLFERLNWLSLLDILLVSAVFYGIFLLLRDTQAMVILRGFVLLIILISLLTALADLPAFSWLVKEALPALLLAIPVVFAPEIRRGLERLGRAGSNYIPLSRAAIKAVSAQTIHAIATAADRLSSKKHGALIIIQRNEKLEDYIATGVQLNASVTTELLMQIFYPNTPLHDGAVIIVGDYVRAASCVMPLSSSHILHKGPERHMGLRHRAALGISEASDALTVIVSEETGVISLAHDGDIMRRLDETQLENILMVLLQSGAEKKMPKGVLKWVRKALKLDEEGSKDAK